MKSNIVKVSFVVNFLINEKAFGIKTPIILAWIFSNLKLLTLVDTAFFPFSITSWIKTKVKRIKLKRLGKYFVTV